jgi:hypothetical protein
MIKILIPAAPQAGSTTSSREFKFKNPIREIRKRKRSFITHKVSVKVKSRKNEIDLVSYGSRRLH